MMGYQTNTVDRALGYSHSAHRFHATSVALGLYQRLQSRGLMHRVKAMLAGHPYRPLDLAAVRETCDVRDRYDAGIQTVPIRHIRGSEGRCEDFDADFRPLHAHSKDRWLSIAVALQMGRMMPPVKLIQVGDIYFVRDGHHRISVARALGQKDIEAEVIVWRVHGTLPWEPKVSSCALANQPAYQAACTQRESPPLRVI